MENVHLAGEDDDIYSGFNEYNAVYDTQVRFEWKCWSTDQSVSHQSKWRPYI